MEKDIASPTEINELLEKAGLSRRSCSKLLNMPYRTLENYCAGYRPCARWIYDLMKCRLYELRKRQLLESEHVTLGKTIKALRKEHGMTQEELAQKLGCISRSTIANIETDRQDVPQAVILKIAKMFDVPINELMDIGNEED